jgi:hypothetical protein
VQLGSLDYQRLAVEKKHLLTRLEARLDVLVSLGREGEGHTREE